jgi:hypothetical protein
MSSGLAIPILIRSNDVTSGILFSKNSFNSSSVYRAAWERRRQLSLVGPDALERPSAQPYLSPLPASLGAWERTKQPFRPLWQVCLGALERPSAQPYLSPLPVSLGAWERTTQPFRPLWQVCLGAWERTTQPFRPLWQVCLGA